MKKKIKKGLEKCDSLKKQVANFVIFDSPNFEF